MKAFGSLTVTGSFPLSSPRGLGSSAAISNGSSEMASVVAERRMEYSVVFRLEDLSRAPTRYVYVVFARSPVSV